MAGGAPQAAAVLAVAATTLLPPPLALLFGPGDAKEPLAPGVLNLANRTGLTDADLERELAQQGEPLTGLDVSHCIRLTDASLQALGSAAGRKAAALEAVDLTCCYELTSAALSDRFLLACGTSLRSLSLSGVSNVDRAVLAVLGAACPGLAHLDLSGCREVTDDGIEAWLAAGSKARRQQAINTDGGGGGGGAGAGGDDGDGSPSSFPLVTLGLRQCTRLTDHSLFALAEELEAGGSSLERLDIGHIPRITDRGVTQIVHAAWPRVLGLAGSNQVTIDCLVDLCLPGRIGPADPSFTSVDRPRRTWAPELLDLTDSMDAAPRSLARLNRVARRARKHETELLARYGAMDDGDGTSSSTSSSSSDRFVLLSGASDPRLAKSIVEEERDRHLTSCLVHLVLFAVGTTVVAAVGAPLFVEAAQLDPAMATNVPFWERDLVTWIHLCLRVWQANEQVIWLAAGVAVAGTSTYFVIAFVFLVVGAGL